MSRTAPTESSGSAPSGSASTPSAPAPAAPAAQPHDRHALRRFLRVWLGVAVVEALLYLFLHRSPELKGLYELPAVAVLVAGAIQSWHARRRRPGRDRRRADRRHGDA